MTEPERKLKQCEKNPAHIWMADIPFCPYCNLSPEERINFDQRNKDQDRAERKRMTNIPQ